MTCLSEKHAKLHCLVLEERWCDIVKVKRSKKQ